MSGFTDLVSKIGTQSKDLWANVKTEVGSVKLPTLNTDSSLSIDAKTQGFLIAFVVVVGVVLYAVFGGRKRKRKKY